MPQGEPTQPTPVKAEAEEKEEPTITESAVPEADVLEEDDDFEDFQNEGDDQAEDGLEDVEWEDNWDDEVEGENEFAKRLRAELEKNKHL